MITLLRFTLLFWRTYLLRTLLTKRTLLVLLGCCVPPAIVWTVLTLPGGPWPIEAFMLPSYIFVLQLMVPLAAVIAGSAVIADEIEDRTITYLLTRPVPRAAILLGRWLATLTILVVFVSSSVLALGAVVEHKSVSFVPREPRQIEVPVHGRRGPPRDGDERPREQHEETRTITVDEPPVAVLAEAMADHRLPKGLLASVLVAALLGVTVYSAVFAALSAWLKHPLIIGLAFTGAIEGFLANLPGKSQSWTVQYYLRSYLLSQHPELWQALEDVALEKFDTAQQAVATLVVILAIALGAGSLLISRKQYVLTA